MASAAGLNVAQNGCGPHAGTGGLHARSLRIPVLSNSLASSRSAHPQVNRHCSLLRRCSFNLYVVHQLVRHTGQILPEAALVTACCPCLAGLGFTVCNSVSRETDSGPQVHILLHQSNAHFLVVGKSDSDSRFVRRK